MPIYIPDSSKVMREMSPITVTTSDNVTREVAEAWYTGSDNVNRLVYQNKLYLMEKGIVNKEIFSGLETKEGGYSYVENRNDSVFIHADRSNYESSKRGYAYAQFVLIGNPSATTAGKLFYDLYKGRRNICFDVNIEHGPTGPADRCLAWFGLGVFETGNQGRGVREGTFTGIVKVDIAGITQEEVNTNYTLGFGAYTVVRDIAINMYIYNVWLE